MRARLTAALLCLPLVSATGCQEDSDTATPPGLTDTGSADAASSDAGSDAFLDPDEMDDVDDEDGTGPDPDSVEPGTDTVDVDSPRVTADLTAFEGPPGAFVRQITDPSDLLQGPAAQGRVGDWVIGNGHVRFVIQGVDRHSGPCPYGGNVIDAGAVREDGSAADVTGEICPFINLGRTFAPEVYEVVSDGSAGAAILAVTGRDELNDFLNIRSLLDTYAPGVSSFIPVDPDAALPVVITQYFVLDGESSSVRAEVAIRNDGEAPISLLVGDLVDSGGTVEFFNPSSSLGGFGYDTFSPEPAAFLGFHAHDAAYAVAPDPGPEGEVAAGYLAISGVAGLVYGTSDILGLALTPADRFAEHPATLTIDPATAASYGRWIVAGPRLSDVTGEIWRRRGVEVYPTEVIVKDVDGAAVEGLRFSVVKDGAAVTHSVSGPDGKASLLMPEGQYELRSDPTERLPVHQDVLGVPGATTLLVSKRTLVAVTVTDALGEPSPAKVTVRCVGPCPGVASPLERDVSFDSLPAGVQAVRFLGPDGKADIPVPVGEYRVVVSRGPVHSVWPENDLAGYHIGVGPGQRVELEAQIQKVVPTPGWMCGDLHVHAVNSPDSPIDNPRRVRSMLSEGVDVLVSTDHDYITDFGPTITEMGAGQLIVSVVGEELTTFDYGHFNGFPLDRDPEDLTGGARDWGGGDGPSLHPTDIFAALGSDPGDQVIQVNHPASGYFSFVKWDATTDATYTPAEQLRIEAPPADAVTGDTHLWSPDFTAIEVMNGLSRSKYEEVARWWYTLLSRGVRRTGTAVSDTHRAISTQSGGSRTWVHVGAGKDTPATFDEALWASRINAGAVSGSNGPFVVLEADADKGAGDTVVVPAGGGPVEIRVTVAVPRWMRVDRVELVGNVTDAAPPPGGGGKYEVVPVAVETIALGPEHLVDDAFYRATVTFTVDAVEDGWYLALVSGSASTPSMFPVVPSSTRPFAFTNPVFIDVGGDGWTPLLTLEDPLPLEEVTPGGPTPPISWAGRAPRSRTEVLELLDRIREARSCNGSDHRLHRTVRGAGPPAE